MFSPTTEQITQFLAILVSAIAYGVLAAILLRQQSPRSLFIPYLALALVWACFAPYFGLSSSWPGLPWQGMAPYLLLVMSALFWVTAGAFLRQARRRAGVWLAVIPLALLAIADSGLVFALSGAASVLLGALLALPGYALAAAALLAEYNRQTSPLHRNRILYWLVGALLLALGPLFVWLLPAPFDLLGVAMHIAGAALVAAVLATPHVTNLAVAMRRLTGALIRILVPGVVTIAATLAVIYLLGAWRLLSFNLTEDLFRGTMIGMAIAGAITFLLYQPVSSLTDSLVNRVLFGQSYDIQQVVRRYGQTVSRIMALDELARTTMQLIDRTLHIRHGALLVPEDAGDGNWHLRVAGGFNVVAGQHTLPVRAGTPLAVWLLQRGAALDQYYLDVDPQFQSLPAEDREAWRRLNMETFFPIRRSGVLIGLLALGVRRSGHPYSSMDRALIATLADQTAVALENATLFDRVRQRAEQLAMLNEIGRMLTSSLDIQQIVSLLSDRLAGAFQATCGHIFLLDQDGSENLVLRKAFGSCAGAAGTIVVQPGQGLVGWVASEGRPVIISDPPTQQQYAPDIDGLLMPDARVALGVPILAKGKTAGVILVADAAPNRLGATEMNLMDAIASFASIAIENAQEVAAREEALRRQVAALQIQIDETKRARDVEAITGTDYFQRLRSTANQLRRRHSAIALAKEESASIPPPATVSPLFSELNTFVNGLSAVGGVTPMAYLDMPAPLRLALNKTARSGPMTRQAFAAELGLSDDETRQIIALLISKGIVLPAGESPANGETMYRLRFGRRPRSRPGIAQKITFD